jgi:hypothetical protein
VILCFLNRSTEQRVYGGVILTNEAFTLLPPTSRTLDATPRLRNSLLDDKDESDDEYDKQRNAVNQQRGPIQMEKHYYEMWNHTTHSIDVPDEHRYFGKDKRLSLEILQDIIHSQKDQAGNTLSVRNKTLPECFVPDTRSARKLAEDVKKGEVKLSNDPVLYMGFPKTGTTTLWHFFECSGYMASHQQQGQVIMDENLRGLGMGNSIFDTKWSRMERRRLVNKATEEGKSEMERRQMIQNLRVAHLQLDNNVRKGYYPQIQLLDEIHQESPQSTFIMAFRPINDWITSVISHHGMANRFGFFEMPGLIFTEKQLELRTHTELRDRDRRPKLSPRQLRRWWCGHVQHIREYVKEYPSHRLIELDLYNNEETSSILSDIFQSKPSCWGHKNKNEDLEAFKNGTIDKLSRTRPHQTRKREKRYPKP